MLRDLKTAIVRYINNNFNDGRRMDSIGNVEIFVNAIFILHARWRFKIVCLHTKHASLEIRKKSNF